MIEDGDTMILNCSATGDPVPTLHWLKLLSSLPVKAVNDFTGALTIPNFNATDNGLYVCVAVSSVGMDISNFTILTSNGEIGQYNIFSCMCMIMHSSLNDFF